MAKPWAIKFYQSKAWQECRTSYIASVYGLCETCKDRGQIEPGKILHHTIYLTPLNITDPNVSLNHELLLYECQGCHNKEHHGGDTKATRDGLMFDGSGNLIRKG